MDTAIVIPAREKLSTVHRCVESVLRHTPEPFGVHLVDVGYAEADRVRLDELAGRHRNLHIVEGTAPLLANAAFNLALAQVHEPFVCVVENDVVVRPGYLQALQETVAELEVDLVSPTILDGQAIRDGHAGRIHFDPPVSELDLAADGYHSTLVRRPKPAWPRVVGRRRIHHLEKHCFAGTREAMKRLAPLDEQICTRTDVDLSLSCHAAGLRIGMATDAEVEFFGPPVDATDLDFFAYRWELDRARRSNEHLVRKWRLRDDHDYLEFVHEMRAFIPAGHRPATPAGNRG